MIKTVVKVGGMMCGMCESHINDAIRRDFQVKKVSSNHGKGETEIISPAALDEQKLKETIEATGYDCVSIVSAPYERRGLFSK
ncbi:MAG: heavy metal-associated domain-containing protein [Clostridia bacterium]|nr:heavy metal-associated domain-containing protein [Clostridia bacterium]